MLVQEELKKTDAQIVAFGATIKESLNFSEKAKDLREFTAAEEKLNTVYNEKKTLQRTMIDSSNEEEKIRKKISALNTQEAQEIAKLRAELTAKTRDMRVAANAAQNQTETYSQLVKETRIAKNESKDLGAQMLKLSKEGQQNSQAYQDLAAQYSATTARAAEMDKELKSIDKSVGDNFRNVGNYEGALTELNTKIEAGGMTMRELTKAIKEYQTIAISAGETSPVGTAAMKKAGELTDKVKDVSDVTRRLSSDTINLDAAMSIGKGLAGAFQAATGAAALFGGKSEEIQRSIQKMVAIQSVFNGIKQVEAMLNKNNIALLKATTIYTKAQTAAQSLYSFATNGANVATKALRATMMTLGIGAIVVGITALVAIIYKWNKSSAEAAEKQKELTERTKRLEEQTRKENQAIAEQSAEFVGLIYQLKATNENSAEREKLMKQINNEYGLTLSNLGDEAAFQAALNQEIATYLVLQRNKMQLQRNEDKFTKTMGDQLTLMERREKKEKELNALETKKLTNQERFIRDQERARLVAAGMNQLDIDRALGEDKEIKRKEQLRLEIDQLTHAIDGYDKGLGGLALTNEQIRQEIDALTQGGKRYEKQTRSNIQRTKEQTQVNRDLYQSLKDRQALLDEIAKAEDAYFQTLNTSQINEENAVRDKYFNLIEMAKKYNVDINTLTIARDSELADIEQKYAKEQLNKQMEAEKKAFDLTDKEAQLANIKKAKTKEEFDRLETQRKIEHLEGLIAIEKKYGNETIDTEIQLAQLKQELIEKKQEQFAEKYAALLNDMYTKTADKAIEAMKRQEAAAEAMFGHFSALAASGNIQAEQSLSAMIERQEEMQRRQEQLERRKLRMQRASQASAILLGALEKGKSVPEALAEMGAFIAASESLFSGFEKGGYTGEGATDEVAGIVHKKEYVLDAKTTNALGLKGLSMQQARNKIMGIQDPMAADIVYQYRTGQLDSAGNSYDIMAINRKLDDVVKAIENQPQQIVGLEETLSGMVKLTVSKKQGNHTKSNKYHS